MEQQQDALEMEIVRKIEEMEAPGYVFPKRFSAADYATVAVSVLVCLVVLFLGIGF